MDERLSRKMMVYHKDSDILEEYDFSKGVRGKYAERYREGTIVNDIDVRA
jgi:hypothetical protein